MVQTSNGEPSLLAAGCPIDQAESYGDCLTYGPGHYETWAQWRRATAALRALGAVVRIRGMALSRCQIEHVANLLDVRLTPGS
jgi:hypothetical protein